ncbi:RBBP9/YdeN family alpha/beta hydrolase [Azohydromonas lata]|uniref:Alpha/beta hydrolase n=1 Tax=Azohydromonas lata TaxID=45677 RepID=A0ABU5IIC9_9BURK|nr:alpha/beta hydrolase [Azohydromonas lata]MDZ5458544.1 alpha/beta hydrolase [Azohydromonas lata]
MSAPRLLIVPGLRDSGPGHWQTWLQRRHRGALRVCQDDWDTPDLPRWAQRVDDTLRQAGGARCIAVAHSFGCLALARCLALRPDAPIAAVFMAAPAEPDKFGVAPLLPRRPLGVPGLLVASDTDPWMQADSALGWAGRWGMETLNLGDAGHINAESGFGPWPLAQRWVEAMAQRLAHREHAAPVRPAPAPAPRLAT